MTARVESDIGPIKCLVNNAGVSTVPCLFKNGNIEVIFKLKSGRGGFMKFVSEMEEDC